MSVKVQLSIRCSGKSWCCDYVKIVAMPALLPVGSLVFPDDKPLRDKLDAWDMCDLKIVEYLWFEDEDFIHCTLEPMKGLGDTAESFMADMALMGWTPNV